MRTARLLVLIMSFSSQAKTSHSFQPLLVPPTGVSITLTTTDDSKVAKTIAKSLIESKLAKCVQIEQVESIYEWDNKIEETQEYRLVIKAPSGNNKQIEEAIHSMHNYKLPQVISFDANGGSTAYLDWVKSI